MQVLVGDMDGTGHAICPICNPQDEINMDRESIPLGDVEDATSLLMTLGMLHGAVLVMGSPGHVIVSIGNRTWTGTTQAGAAEGQGRTGRSQGGIMNDLIKISISGSALTTGVTAILVSGFPTFILFLVTIVLVTTRVAIGTQGRRQIESRPW